MKILFHETNLDQDIKVCDTAELYGEAGNFRILQFANSAIQGALDLDNPDRLVFEYPRAMIHLMDFNFPQFEDVFMIGHGIGAIPRFYPGKYFKIAEFNPIVAELSRTYFGYSQNNVRIGDGRQILQSQDEQSYHYILVDAFTEQGTPLHLTSREFFQMACNKLTHQGSIMMNLFGKGVNDPLIKAIHTTLSLEFAYTKAFLLPSDHNNEFKNVLIMGSHSPIGYQARNMAGFQEIELQQGHIITDIRL